MGGGTDLNHMENKFSAKEELHSLEKTGEYVFHGSPFKLEILEPNQAYNRQKKEGGEYDDVPDGEPAVFASPSVDAAIFLAVINHTNAPLGSWAGFTYNNKKGHFGFRATKETMDQINEKTIGYVYVLDKNKFEIGDANEPVSYKAISPVKVIEVKKEDLPSIEIKDF